MDYYEILANIHAGGYEFEVMEYLSRWAKDYSHRKDLENCHLRSSLDLLRKFNDEKWHIRLIDALTEEDNNGEVL